MSEAAGDAFIRKVGAVGRITLTRPQSHNALTHAMVLAMLEALVAWRRDPDIRLILVDAEGEKAFCAGGDIAALYKSGVAGDLELGRRFWRDEYRLNALIANYPKPFVAVMHGIVMGGGVGLSSHGSHRIVTERSIIAMPECSIGLIPDVGGTLLLAKAPGYMGEYLGLTGARAGPADAVEAGLADCLVPLALLPELKERLSETADPAVVAEFQASLPQGSLSGARGEIDAIFSAATITEIKGRLSQSKSSWARDALKNIEAGSPLSLLVTLRAIRAARSSRSIEGALTNEFRFVSRSMEQGDFLEGVRAALIDKDRKPSWRFAEPDSVPAHIVASMFEPAPGGDVDVQHELGDMQ
ncbi:enoyl-CoA hydratase/isomerase family protein [Mesorhizobium sp. 2RAF21]|uniref:enoyl-CoA hydratase/isomerase family protein n=1 Tax=Mesorhizobium sp. 2RAF21 TaxID=3232995 RepID=UPI003F9D090E